jgi:hypothetical protein
MAEVPFCQEAQHIEATRRPQHAEADGELIRDRSLRGATFEGDEPPPLTGD